MRKAAFVAVVAAFGLAACAGDQGGLAPATVTVTHTTTATATMTATPAPSSTPTTTPPSPTQSSQTALQQWKQKVGGGYEEADAKWACDTLRENKETAAWEAVGDSRLIWAGRLLCTEFKKDVALAEFGFRDGVFEVGKAPSESVVTPGTYQSLPGTTDCYWERSTATGDAIANDFVTNAPAGVKVTIRATDGGFKAEGCGPWRKLG